MKRNRTHRTMQPAAIAAMLLAALLLAACGSSASKTSTVASTSAGAAASGSGTGGARSGRFTALRECLKKQGITLPQRVPGKTGSRPPGGGAVPFGGGFQGGKLPAGVSRAKFEAALAKCGGARGGRLGAGARLHNPAFTAVLAKFATCMRGQGIAIPKPNTSGNGPVFSTKGLDTTSAKFRAAEQKCLPLLRLPHTGGAAPGGGVGAPGGA